MTTRRCLFVIPMILIVANCAHVGSPTAATDPVASEGASAMPSFVWHDGEREHWVWMNPGLVAELGPSPQGAARLSQATVLADSNAGSEHIRYWKMDRGMTSEQALQQLAREPASGRYSPVLHDAPNGDGPIRLLPGNVVVVLDPGWTKDAVGQWIARRKLRVVSELPFAPNMLLLHTEAGLPALELANTLHRSGEVKAAFPDWLAQKVVK